MVSQSVCEQCNMPCTSYRFYCNKRVCFTCKLPDDRPSPGRVDPMRRVVKNREGRETVLAYGDRFLWHTFKWYIVDFVEAEKDVVVRLEGTADVVTLPELLVGELVEDFNLSTMYWR